MVDVQPADSMRLTADDYVQETTSRSAEAAWSTVQPRHHPASYGAAIADALWVHAGPCIFVIGLCGNTLILLVMSQRRMRGTSTCVYLQWMAVADICVLITGMITEWVEARFDVEFKGLDERLCKLEKFLFYTSGDAAIWICVAFTVDRFLAVCFPLKHRRVACLGPSYAKYCAMGAWLVAVAKNLHVVWTRGAQYRTVERSLNASSTVTEMLLVKNCGRPTVSYLHFEKYVRPWIAFSLVFAVPFCVIVFCNVFIVRAMIRYRRARRLNLIVSAQDHSVFQMTALCLSASFCFLVCVTPSMVLLIGKPYWNEPPSDWYAIAKSVTNQIFYVNHSANFFLYCMTGRRFRRALWSLCRCRTSEFDRFSTDPAAAQHSLANRTRISPSPGAAAAIKKRRSTMDGALNLWSPPEPSPLAASYLIPTGKLRSEVAGLEQLYSSSPALLLSVRPLRRESNV